MNKDTSVTNNKSNCKTETIKTTKITAKCQVTNNKRLERKGINHRKRAHKHKDNKSSTTGNRYAINASSKTFATPAFSLLDKGLKFVPTPAPMKWKDVYNNFKEFAESMRYRFVAADTHENNIRNPFHQSNKMQIQLTNSVNLENYLANTLSDLSDLMAKKTTNKSPKTKYNLSKQETEALKNLKSDKSVIIKPSDKSGTLVILDREDYIREGHRQLRNNETYSELKQDITLEISYKVENYLKEMLRENQIDLKTFKYLNPRLHPIKTPEFYHIAKVHKEKSEIGTYKGRPIISGISSPTERISQFVDYFLNPIAQDQETYLKDSKSLIQILESTNIPQNSILVTGDIESMYNNLLQSPAISIIQTAFEKEVYRKYDIKRPDTKYITGLFELVIRNNVFKFAGDFYKQEIGLAMGSKVSPSASDVIVYSYEKKWLQYFKNNIHLYKRYRDDIFVIWKGDELTLKSFMSMGNKLAERLKFEFKTSVNQVDFLDLCIYKGPRFAECGKLDIKTYSKPTNKFQYLDRTSAHPEHIFKAVIRGELTRHLRNTNQKVEYAQLCENLKSRLIDRNYKDTEIDKEIQLRRHEDRCRFVQEKVKHQIKAPSKRKKLSPLIYKCKFDPRIPKHRMYRVMYKHWHYVQRDPVLNKIFLTKPRIILTKNRNLAKELVRAAL